MKVEKTFIFTSEPPPILAKQSSARREKCKMKVEKTFIFTSEPPPILVEQSSARRAGYKTKVQNPNASGMHPESKQRLLFPKKSSNRKQKSYNHLNTLLGSVVKRILKVSIITSHHPP